MPEIWQEKHMGFLADAYNELYGNLGNCYTSDGFRPGEKEGRALTARLEAAVVKFGEQELLKKAAEFVQKNNPDQTGLGGFELRRPPERHGYYYEGPWIKYAYDWTRYRAMGSVPIEAFMGWLGM